MRTLAAGLAALLLAGAAPLAGVGSADGRAVVDGTVAPWTSVARLQVPGSGRCTAVLVGPRTALTAAHCVWIRRLGHIAPAASVHVLTRYAGGGFAGHSVAAALRLAPGYDPAKPDPARDVAVVTLVDAIGADPLGFATDVAAGGAVVLGGYNQDRAEVIEADARCHVLDASATLLRHDCAGTHGTSGAPLLARDADGTWRIAGLQVAAFTTQGGGIAVAAAVLQDLLDHAGGAP